MLPGIPENGADGQSPLPQLSGMGGNHPSSTGPKERLGGNSDNTALPSEITLSEWLGHFFSLTAGHGQRRVLSLPSCFV